MNAWLPGRINIWHTSNDRPLAKCGYVLVHKKDFQGKPTTIIGEFISTPDGIKLVDLRNIVIPEIYHWAWIEDVQCPPVKEEKYEIRYPS